MIGRRPLVALALVGAFAIGWQRARHLAGIARQGKESGMCGADIRSPLESAEPLPRSGIVLFVPEAGEPGAPNVESDAGRSYWAERFVCARFELAPARLVLADDPDAGAAGWRLTASPSRLRLERIDRPEGEAR